MIDGVDLPVEAVNYPVRIEVIDGEMLTATIRWVDDGRAGLAFDQAFDLRRLNAANVRRAA
jgi:hypothetical protein